MLLTGILLVLLFIVLSGLFSGLEIAYISANRVRVHHLAQSGNRTAQLLERLLRNPDRYLSICLFGINANNVAAPVVFMAFIFDGLGLDWSIEVRSLVTVAVLTPIMVVFAEVVPKALFYARATAIALVFVKPLIVVYIIFFPIIGLVQGIAWLFQRLIGGHKATGQGFFASREELQHSFILRGHSSVENERYQGYISEILHLSETTVREVMTPLVDVHSVDRNKSIEEARQDILQIREDWVPVYEDRSDNLVGFIVGTDVFWEANTSRVSEFMQPAFYVPETKAVSELIDEMRNRRTPLAIVVDEYGGVSGVVSDVALLQVIIGTLKAFGKDDEIVSSDDSSGVEVDAQIDIDDLNDYLGTNLEKQGYETLSGYLAMRHGRIPRVNDSLLDQAHRFTVISANDRAIHRVRIEPVNPDD